MATNFYINQSIVIGQFKVGGVANSSVLQIGSVGMIKPIAEFCNSGNFTKPAPKIISKDQAILKTSP